jgi:hypothetical protein
MAADLKDEEGELVRAHFMHMRCHCRQHLQLVVNRMGKMMHKVDASVTCYGRKHAAALVHVCAAIYLH